MEIIFISAVLMENGEIIINGKKIGYIDKLNKFIFEVKEKLLNTDIVITKK